MNRIELRRSAHDRPSDATGAVSFDDAIADASSVLGRDLLSFAAEPRHGEIEAAISSSREPSFSPYYDAAVTLRRLCYVLCRALEPKVVVESGVANGATSAYLVAALAANGSGCLHSIDWISGGPRQQRPVGDYVPDELRSRWVLEPGPSRRVLPRLLRRVDPPALFVHDSDHTERNVRRELDAVLPAMCRPGAILVDDLQLNDTFRSWIDAAVPAYSARVLTEKGSLVGLAILA